MSQPETPSFHIQQNSTPFALTTLLRLAMRTQPVSADEFASQSGLAEGVAALVVSFFRKQSIVEQKSRSLTPFGGRLAALSDDRAELVGEAVHLNLRTRHWVDPDGAGYAFAYGTLCDFLFDRGETPVDGTLIAQAVAHVIAQVGESYGADPASVSFSDKSVQGARNWLRTLDPPVLLGGNEEGGRRLTFARRHTADAFAVLWAVSLLYERDGRPFGTRLSLGEAEQDLLARLLFLEPDAAHRAVQVAAEQFDSRRPGGILGFGSEGGYGFWVQLDRPVPVGATEWEGGAA